MGFGRVIGGALAGAGAGMSALAESRELERRQAALENLRSQNEQTEAVQRADLQDRNNAREWGYRTDSALEIGEQEGAQAAAAGAAKREAEARKAQEDRDHEVRMARLKSELGRADDAAKAALSANDVKTTFVAENGEMMIVTNAGKTVPTGITATEKDRYNSRGSGSESGGTLADLRGGSTAPAPRTAPAPASTPAAQPAKAQGGDRTMTQADIDATASANGITPEMARRLLEQRGFKLKG